MGDDPGAGNRGQDPRRAAADRDQIGPTRAVEYPDGHHGADDGEGRQRTGGAGRGAADERGGLPTSPVSTRKGSGCRGEQREHCGRSCAADPPVAGERVTAVHVEPAQVLAGGDEHRHGRHHRGGGSRRSGRRCGPGRRATTSAATTTPTRTPRTYRGPRLQQRHPGDLRRAPRCWISRPSTSRPRRRSDAPTMRHSPSRTAPSPAPSMGNRSAHAAPCLAGGDGVRRQPTAGSVTGQSDLVPGSPEGPPYCSTPVSAIVRPSSARTSRASGRTAGRRDPGHPLRRPAQEQLVGSARLVLTPTSPWSS